jgi:serine/threonine-protein kinase
MDVTQGSGVGEEWPVTGVLLSQRYRLAKKLAASGMSEIWRADDGLLGRAVAIKLPRPQVSEVVYQAWTEARTTAKLSDPHIAAVHDYGEALRPDGSIAPYVVMELLGGESLAARLTRGPLTWQEAARIGSAVASGLATAHARRVVHRDIKPGNIMLTPAGIKILDFGISTVTGAPDDDATGATFGTPAYVAPERLDGTPAEPATDVYGLGAVLFEMVKGEPPYPVDTWEEFAAARKRGRSRLPEGLPGVFREAVERCLAEDPQARPPAAEVRDKLSALRPPSVAASARGRVSAFAGRPVVRAATVVLLLVAAVAAVGLGSWSRDRAEAPRATPARTGPSTMPATPSPSTIPTTGTPLPTSTTLQPTLTLGAAVDSVISAVRAGQSAGQIRDDVAVDLINLLRQLNTTAPKDLGRRVAELQQKILDRIDEGSLSAGYADELQNRLDRVARV